MKVRKLLMLVVVMCMASVAKAQFYDSADEIFYYVATEEYYQDTQQSYERKGGFYVPTLEWVTKKREYNDSRSPVVIFNFDGKKAALLGDATVGDIKKNMQESSSYFENKVETTDYDVNYVSSTMRSKFEWQNEYLPSYGTLYKNSSSFFYFSNDRNKLVMTGNGGTHVYIFKNVAKSYFKVGRSRTPSGTLHE